MKRAVAWVKPLAGRPTAWMRGFLPSTVPPRAGRERLRTDHQGSRQSSDQDHSLSRSRGNRQRPGRRGPPRQRLPHALAPGEPGRSRGRDRNRLDRGRAEAGDSRHQHRRNPRCAMSAPRSAHSTLFSSCRDWRLCRCASGVTTRMPSRSLNFCALIPRWPMSFFRDTDRRGQAQGRCLFQDRQPWSAGRLRAEGRPPSRRGLGSRFSGSQATAKSSRSA